ncbi:MAG: hypothetical protein FJ347_01005 [Sphingomonadales bacterium]|nr:hypothetical protein [Sphingomonadales bacterium]
MPNRLFFVLSVLLFSFQSLCAQEDKKDTRLMLGFNAGANFSRTANSDTFPANFTKRNRLGIALGLNGVYDISSNAGIAFGANFVQKGYKLNNDTLAINPDIVRKFWSINVPLGLHFRQQFNAQNFITEKFGIVANFNLRGDSTSLTNNDKKPAFRINEYSTRNIYPMFYLGFAMGGTSENNNRYEFGITYTQSLSNDASIMVAHSDGLKKQFPLNYRGGFLHIGFSYYFNLSNFKKSNGYFY